MLKYFRGTREQVPPVRASSWLRRFQMFVLFTTMQERPVAERLKRLTAVLKVTGSSPIRN